MKLKKQQVQSALNAFEADQLVDLNQVKGGRPPQDPNAVNSAYLGYTAEYSKYGGPPIGIDRYLDTD